MSDLIAHHKSSVLFFYCDHMMTENTTCTFAQFVSSTSDGSYTLSQLLFTFPQGQHVQYINPS